jgi:hypothetical protein
MSTRVDALEAAVQDIINGDITVPSQALSVPASPARAPHGILRSKSEGGALLEHEFASTT